MKNLLWSFDINYLYVFIIKVDTTNNNKCTLRYTGIYASQTFNRIFIYKVPLFKLGVLLNFIFAFLKRNSGSDQKRITRGRRRVRRANSSGGKTSGFRRSTMHFVAFMKR